MVDTFTYNPNHSEEVRKILANATPEERQAYLDLSKLSLGYIATGFIVGLAPMMWIMIAGMAGDSEVETIFNAQNVAIMFIGIGLGAAIVLWHIRMTRRAVRKLLVTFAWAEEQGITEESLKLDTWG